MIYPANEESLRIAAAALRAGEPVAFPTETVYGLGAGAFNPRALAKIFEIKGRPRFDPLIVHIAGLETLGDVVDLEALAPGVRDEVRRIGEAFWPGPLTLVLPKLPSVPDLATAGLATVAVRIPVHPVARELIRLSTGAVAAPSANRFGRLSPTRAEHVAEQLGDRLEIILDGGPAEVGIESTVLDMTDRPRILRPGGLPRARLEALLGPLPVSGLPVSGPSGELHSPGVWNSPGLLTSHYAPRTPLYLHDSGEMAGLEYREDEGYLFFSRGHGEPGDRGGALEVLSDEGDSLEAAANLFAALHRLDSLGLRAIHAEAAPPQALGEAINDRLRRAAAREP
ncbi:MAG: threonylcarbamoyl-AMP synthase [Treponema sp.]|jgi:L-threonylcarbamoyladenylate synthase|nr:threonylcarbamoyl-AMP synthase [Treponema sp.]